MKRFLVPFGIVIFLIGSGIVFFMKQSPQNQMLEVETVHLAVYRGEFSSLIWIADDQDFFTDNGLNVIIKEYESGVEPVQELLAGRAEIATAGEFVSVMQGFNNRNLRIIGSINTADAIEVIATRESGIQQPADLKGKKIGLKKKSQAEFYLGTFLLLNQLSYDDVEIVDLSPGSMLDALNKATVDAVVIWDPVTFHIKQSIGEKTISWSAQSDRPFYFLLNVVEEFIQEKPQVVIRFLKAMIQAEEFIQENTKEAQEIIQKHLDLEQDYLQNVWLKNNFHVTLTQDLLMAMEDEAGWAIDKKMTSSTQVPNYLKFFYIEGLKQLQPASVDVVY